MARELGDGRLLLGPIVGHTDSDSTRIWIRVSGDPRQYSLRVSRGGVFSFHGTEDSSPEFGTAVAIAQGLRPDWQYSYDVLRRGRTVARGSFRTMPPVGSVADVTFASLSCNAPPTASWGSAWELLHQFVRTQQPRFLLMMGDQVYMDQEGNVWEEHFDSPRDVRRRAMAQKYQDQWSREPIRTIMANVPTYMVWDDHDIRDGWGSWASDSLTLMAKYPSWQKHGRKYQEYFEDARDLYWHFQLAHGHTNMSGPPQPGSRVAMPYVFGGGRLLVVVTDSRGERDLWRISNPVLGDAQWASLETLLRNIPPHIDAVAVVTSVPMAAMDPESISQRTLGRRTDDVDLVKNGKPEEMWELQRWESRHGKFEAAVVYYGHGIPATASDYRISEIDDVRDSWAHEYSRPEQERLIRAVALAAQGNRPPGQERGVVFLGGDIHVGALFNITVMDPPLQAQSVVASSISQEIPPENAFVAQVGKKHFDVAGGIVSDMEYFARAHNFGVTEVVFTGGRPIVRNAIVHPERARYVVYRFPPPLPKKTA